MPHAGGGGSGGGFHSSGRGSSNFKSSVPKTDKYGHPHSRYYVGPGFYYNRVYIPFDSDKRMLYALKNSIIVLAFTIIIMIIMLISIIYKGTSVDYAIENYTLNQYEKTYDESSSYYEKNILVCFVAYKDNDEYVLFNVVGDDIDYEIDRSFGGIGTSFGNAVNDNVPSRNYYGNLYFSLATSLDKVNENLYTKYESSNPKAYKVINKTKYGTINGISSLNDAQEIFYQKTGYNVSFLIVEPGQVSSINYFALVVIIVIGGIIIAAGVLNMFKIKKAVLNFSAEFNKGNQAKYFEGEDTYENYMKEYGSKHNFDVFEDEEKE